jgi:hypothetical protein
LFEALGDELYVLIASSNLAWVTGDLGDPDGERALLEENLLRARRLGNRRMEAGVLGNLAIFARDEGRLDEAVALSQEAIRIVHRLGNLLDLAVEVGRLAAILAPAGKATEAARLLGSSAALTEQLGAKAFWWAEKRNAETLEVLLHSVEAATLDAEVEAGRRLQPDEAVALALDQSIRQ